MTDFVVGEHYSLNDIASLAGGAAITSEDLIVTDELAWSRMTVGRLMLWLQEELEAGLMTRDSVVFVDSDPEGNGLHPMRACASPLALGADGRVDEEAETVDLPAPAIWFGVGY